MLIALLPFNKVDIFTCFRRNISTISPNESATKIAGSRMARYEGQLLSETTAMIANPPSNINGMTINIPITNPKDPIICLMIASIFFILFLVL
jgi:hypothetical protein